MADEKCFGSYIHGILDNPPVIERILNPFMKGERTSDFNPAKYHEQQYNLLADWLRKYIDIERIYKIIQGND